MNKELTNHLYIGLGSNLGDREALLNEALQLIDERVGHVARVSTFYETEPWGFESEHSFINAAALVLTSLSPRQCLVEVERIERLLGRTSKSSDGVYEDRTIDIDLLLYNDLTINEPDLVIPHPLIQQRDFVRLPLEEIMEEDE